MPVHIRDFSVETNDQSQAEVATPPAVPDTAPRPQTARDISRFLRALNYRASRLHAD